MKKVLSLIMAMLLLLCAFAGCSKDEDTEGGTIDPVETNENAHEVGNTHKDVFYYDYINGDEVAITGYAGSHEPHAITVPAEIDARPVTAVANGAFKSKTNLTEVALPDTVNQIGDYAFAGCSALTKINIPAAVTLVGDAAFANTALTEVVLPDAVLSVGVGAFASCKALLTVTLPAELAVVATSTFQFCENLHTVSGGKVETVEDSAFLGCAHLAGIDFTNVKTVGNYAFAGCTALETPDTTGMTVGTNAFYK